MRANNKLMWGASLVLGASLASACTTSNHSEDGVTDSSSVTGETTRAPGSSSSSSSGTQTTSTTAGPTSTGSATTADAATSEHSTSTTSGTTSATTESATTESATTESATTDVATSSASDTGGVCGDGVVARDEQCDGDDLSGFTCQDLGYRGGTLVCDPVWCTYDTALCLT